jgi:diphosphomevalonate decarboxylase
MTDNFFRNKYIKDGAALKDPRTGIENIVGWNSPSNIALIKYWGKYGDQLPRNPSVSFTLAKSYSQMKVNYRVSDDGYKLEYYFNEIRNHNFERKLNLYLKSLFPFLPFLEKLSMKISSHNTFPHSAGIASSASSISALAMCLCSMEQALFGTLSDKVGFHQKASFLARLGSGSASRSVFGSTVLWGYVPSVPDSSDEIAMPIDSIVHPVFKDYCDAILVVDSTPKEISSSVGHNLMNYHFFHETRIMQANSNLSEIIKVLRTGDESKFAEIVENEALTLHGLLLSSVPGFILLHPNTLILIKNLKEFRNQSGIQFAFTLDAGPNIHVLYARKVKNEMNAFLNNELKQYCEMGLWIDDQLSEGPVSIDLSNYQK